MNMPWHELQLTMFLRGLSFLSQSRISSTLYLSFKPSRPSQWSLVYSFLQDFICISFVWLISFGEQSETKLMQKKSRTRIWTRLYWLERLGFIMSNAKNIELLTWFQL